ncbi:NAD(P)H-binding protein [Mycobacterium montefiorense]|uniref:NAD(P)-dependent oxidoreductase n=1 Tax=Mycobacterium montefiorense TaxID=154654 RepID=A0AA37PMG7_9MYCO|nr:NAD(P)H-binding protein [Mycobacterium montefiorense]GBG37228.1 NAD(P)-dependent oxidoreductase [Mycobacterium montefiorense]GKU36205.1 NAD(P)-dependent oxidoreductase [Mycobacterium montefiorense]GKU39628.1 NAD(P)-dependent oxidoreductase [Mycobacterium montefiorense]GKU46861.1 NAD(P)-dependent oxidoreductase [Mycobacterium montefiorense]GKU48966.1 NAD(P)-dependent oxidoreductase [Mycobacterium montefiorense]
MYLITGAGGGIGGVSRMVVEELRSRGEQVRAMVHRDDERADALRALGAEVVVGDLTEPRDVVDAMAGVDRMFFSMSVSPDYLQATAVVCAAALESGRLEVIVNMSQMTVSQMTLTSTDESRQHRLHWLAERVTNWSGVPAVHIRPTTFLDNPIFTALAAPALRERNVLQLPFGTGRTSPIAASDVARVVAAVLLNPADRIGAVYELTGPASLDIDELAAQYARALHRPITGADVAHDTWVKEVLQPLGLPAHVAQHLATMAKLHRAGRYDRSTDDVRQITGQPALSVEQYVAANPQLFA